MNLVLAVLREEMKRVYWYSFWSIALFHLLGTAGAMLKAFSMGMSRFDSGAPISGTEQFLMALGRILAFPVAALSLKFKCLQLPGILGWIPFILNSLLWAGIVIGIIMAVGKLRRSQNHTSDVIVAKRAETSR